MKSFINSLYLHLSETLIKLNIVTNNVQILTKISQIHIKFKFQKNYPKILECETF